MKINTAIPKKYNSPVFLLFAIALTLIVAGATAYYVEQLMDNAGTASQSASY